MVVRRDRLYKIYPLLGLGLFAAATSWLVRIAQPPADAEEPVASTSPDMIVDDFTLKRFDVEGQQQFVFSAVEMRHFEFPERTELSRPHLLFMGHDAPIEARAERGTASKDGDTLYLEGDVIVTRAALADRPAATLRTEALTVWPENERVAGTVPVIYEAGPNRITAGRFSADNLQGTLQLEGGVTALVKR